MDNFNGRTVAITGGATGIGFALGKALGGEGARIVIGEPRQERLDQAVDAFADAGVEARATVLDVTDPESMETFADFAWAQWGGVSMLINNAGIAQPMVPVTELRLDKLHAVMDVNFFGVWYGCASFGRRMLEAGNGAAIYNLGSENSFFTAVPSTSAYVASKHAVLGLTEAFREEVAGRIEVGTIFPGFVKSELTAGPFGEKAMDTDEFAALVVEQIKAGEHFIVSHAYNIERIEPRWNELREAYTKYAPRYEGDDEYDVRTLIAQMTSGGS